MIIEDDIFKKKIGFERNVNFEKTKTLFLVKSTFKNPFMSRKVHLGHILHQIHL
jgi:hypothetical protein